MRRSRSLALAALLCVLARPSRSADYYLSKQFPQDCRDQGGVGACHTFASVALLEAAIKRNYPADYPEGKYERLSEADLFVRRNLKGGGNYRIETKTEKQGDTEVEYVDVSILEGGDPLKDIDFALRAGVAPRELVAWDKFNEAYMEFKKGLTEACRKKARNSWAECLKGLDTMQAFLDYMGTVKDKGGVEKVLLGENEDVAAGRRRILGELRGLEADAKYRDKGDYDAITDADLTDKDACKRKGEKQRDDIVRHLSHHRPVVICFTLKGLTKWGWETVKKKSDALHCVAVTGYSDGGKRARKPAILRTRNSWGEERSNFDIDEREFCAIQEVVWITP